MAERTAIQELVQLGMEVTEGTAVPATKRLQATMIDFTPQVNVRPIRGSGYKLPSVNTLNKEWSTARVTGEPTYEEIIYPLSSLLKKVTPVVGGTTSQVWTFDPSDTALETTQSYTVEYGQAVRAEQMPGGKFDSFGMTVNRDGSSLTGTMLAQAIVDPFTLTPTGVTELHLTPMLPAQFCIYADPTSTALGTTKLLRVAEFSWTWGQQWGPLWALDCAKPSYVATVELEPRATGNLVVEADAAGMAFLQNLRAGSTVFMRCEATGPLIETTHNYKFTADFAFQMGGLSFTPREGITCAQWPLQMVHDSTWGRGIKITVENLATAL